MAEDLKIACGCVHYIVANALNLRHVAANLAPKHLHFMPKRDGVANAKNIISKDKSDPLLIKRIIIGGATRAYESDTQSRHQASERRVPHVPRPKTHIVFSRARK